MWNPKENKFSLSSSISLPPFVHVAVSLFDTLFFKHSLSTLIFPKKETLLCSSSSWRHHTFLWVNEQLSLWPFNLTSKLHSDFRRKSYIYDQDQTKPILTVCDSLWVLYSFQFYWKYSLSMFTNLNIFMLLRANGNFKISVIPFVESLWLFLPASTDTAAFKEKSCQAKHRPKECGNYLFRSPNWLQKRHHWCTLSECKWQ